MIPSTPSPSPNGLADAVGRALSTAFEDMVFMEASSLQDYQQSGIAQVWSHVTTEAPVSAEFSLQMSPSLVDACIEILYADLPPDDAIRQDVVRELLNTIAGLVMSNISEDEGIQLGLPDSGVGSPPAVALSPELARHYTSDLGGLALTVHWR